MRSCESRPSKQRPLLNLPADPAPTIRIGRQSDNDIALTGNLEVSRHHAELRRNPDGSFEIIDLGSHGGTFVNGERITRKMLTEQDIISIGHATFRLSGGELRQYAERLPLRLAPRRAADRRRRPARSQLDRVHRAGRHPARPVLLRTRRRRQDRPDHRLLARSLRTSS